MMASKNSLFTMAVLVFFLTWLSGCATETTGTAGQADLATASDETEQQKRAKIRLELAQGYLEQGQLTVALDEAKLAINADPRSTDAYNLRGLIYMRLNDMGLARDSFTRAASLNPRDGNVLHNLGWLSCQEARYAESIVYFDRALASPAYQGQANTWLTKGVCFMRAGDKRQAESSFLRALEFDAANPITGYNLANLMYQRQELVRAQFYIRRLNNSEFSNAESLWLAAKIERKLGNQVGVTQLGESLKKRFPESKEMSLFDRGLFND